MARKIQCDKCSKVGETVEVPKGSLPYKWAFVSIRSDVASVELTLCTECVTKVYDVVFKNEADVVASLIPK